MRIKNCVQWVESALESMEDPCKEEMERWDFYGKRLLLYAVILEVYRESSALSHADFLITVMYTRVRL